MEKKSKQKDAEAQAEVKVTRNELMLQAKERGIKNFRVLNKAELEEVLAKGVTPEQIQKVISGAVDRWKSGWGKKKKK